MVEANHDLAGSLSFSTEENQPGITLGFGFFSTSEEMIKTLETCWKLLTILQSMSLSGKLTNNKTENLHDN